MDMPQVAEQKRKPTIAPPLWLLAELTYRCPLHCVFCYNPVDYASNLNELTTDQWISVMRQAREMGAAQLGFSGGEPLLRDDLEILVAEGRQLGFYTNLITSGVGLKRERLAALREAGLDHIQLSFQDSTREMNDFLTHTKTFDLKSRVASMIREFEYPMVLNVVLHRYNLDHIERIIEMADKMGVEYLELANTQYYGWGLINREQLLPDREQLQRAEAAVARYREKIGNRMRILFVVPDYFEKRPKACMNGWGSVFLAISADGSALPCHAAKTIPGLQFPQVTDTALHDIWYHSDAFNKFRGDAWMQEPCRTCPEKERDFGGCRCQALALTGNAANADPVCDKSPYHHVITDMIGRKPTVAVQEKPLVFRNDANSRRLSADMATGVPASEDKMSPL